MRDIGAFIYYVHFIGFIKKSQNIKLDKAGRKITLSSALISNSKINKVNIKDYKAISSLCIYS